jgi:hypothetical protein
MRTFVRSIFPVFITVAAIAGETADRPQAAPPDSPFLTANAPASGQPAGPGEPFQLTGISVVGDKTFVSIFDAAERHSLWITVGESVGDIHVISCNVATEQSVVRIGEKLSVLTLRKPTVTAAAFAPMPDAAAASADASPATAASAAVSPPVAEDDKEAREARMLVTDLLEIGMQQRKAYEEAQKKAAGTANTP